MPNDTEIMPEPVIATAASDATATVTADAPSVPAEPAPLPDSVPQMVITDIRGMFADSEPVHREIVADIRNPERIPVEQAEYLDELRKAVGKRDFLASMECNIALPSDEHKELHGEYFDSLARCHVLKRIALKGS